MSMKRRTLLKAGAALAATAGMPRLAEAQVTYAPQPGTWRKFQVVTRVEIADAGGKSQAWIPIPSVNQADWFNSGVSRWTTNGRASLVQDSKYGSGFIHVQWAGIQEPPQIEVISDFAAQDRAVNLAKPGKVAPLSDAERKLYTSATTLIPTDGVVKDTALEIVGRTRNDVERARRIFEWVVDNTARNAATRGCGIGDVASMIRSGDLTGKCADLNALYVGLARAAGLPARDVYGLRVAPSKFGFRSLGAGSEVVTKAQHCRAEVYLAGFGWVPVDPADVRKVVLEEPPGNLTLYDPKVMAARKALFGSWEGNWMAYNFAHDIALPGAQGSLLEFLMYPQAETAAGRLDPLEPESFKYTITAKELSA